MFGLSITLMQQQLLLFLSLILCINLTYAQNHATQDFQFEISPAIGANFVPQKVQFNLQKTSPFIAVSAVVKGSNLDENVKLLVRALVDGEYTHTWVEMTRDHDFENTENEIHFPPIFLNSSNTSFDYKLIGTSSGIVAFRLFVPDNVQAESSLGEAENEAARACSCAQPASVARSSWGSSFGLTANSSCSSPSYTTVTHLIVHHAAGTNTSSNWASVVASYWDYHVNSNKWCDIGYNWLIDPNGVLYVGRGGGNNVVGAHMCGYNAHTMGVCMLGNYDTATPSTAAMNKLTELLAWKSCNANINPLGSGSINSYPGTMNNISGHKDGCSPGYTSCPGANLYSRIGSLRNAVNGYINNGCTHAQQPSNPINDYCSGAIDLTSKITCDYQTFSNAGATGSMAAVSPCNGFTGGNADDDVWFKFTAISNEHSVHLLNGASFDGVLDVRSGTCNSSVSIGCDDQTGSTGVLNTVALANLTIGETYFVRVYHYGAGSGGSSFQLCLTHPQPTCAEVSLRNTTNITATSAKFEWSAVSGANTYEIWYKRAGASSYTKTTTSNTSIAVSNLDCNANYEWGVSTLCSNGSNSGAPSSFVPFKTLSDVPNATIQHNANGYDISFSTNTSGNPTTFRWNFGDGSPLDFQQNPTHTFPANGVATLYKVTLFISNYCDSQLITYPFTLNPDCNFSIDQSSATLDSSFQTINVQLSNIANCTWTASSACGFVAVSPASGSGGTSISITVAENNDTASRTCTIDIAGQSFSIFQNGKIAPAVCEFSIAQNSKTIDSNAQQIVVQLSNAANCNWSTFSGCGFVSVNPVSGIGSESVTINVTANNDTTTRVCNILIADKSFTIIQHGKEAPKNPCAQPLSTPPLVVNGCDLTSSPEISEVDYSWYRNGILMDGITGRFFTVEDDAAYFYIKITDENHCTAQSEDVYVNCVESPLKIDEIQESTVKIIPNPASQEIVILWNTNQSEKCDIRVYDALGQIVFSKNGVENAVSFSVEKWVSAVYFFSLRSEQNFIKSKFAVKH